MTGPREPARRPRCAAGRWAFFGGRWLGIPPCKDYPRHHIMCELPGNGIDLCERHFQQVLAAGLVTHPYIGNWSNQ